MFLGQFKWPSLFKSQKPVPALRVKAGVCFEGWALQKVITQALSPGIASEHTGGVMLQACADRGLMSTWAVP
jgi:hypothetical protein